MGTNPAELLSRVRALPAAPRVYAMQLVAGRRFFFNGFHGTATARGTVFRQPPALPCRRWAGLRCSTPGMTMPTRWLPRPEGRCHGTQAVRPTGRRSVRRLTEAAHRAGMPVWGHAWVQPASALEQAQAGMDGVVHSAGLAGELFDRPIGTRW